MKDKNIIVWYDKKINYWVAKSVKYRSLAAVGPSAAKTGADLSAMINLIDPVKRLAL